MNIGDTVWDANLKKCVSCPAERPIVDRISGECAAPCPPETPIWTGVICVDVPSHCRLNKQFFDQTNEVCVDTCSETHDSHNVCRTCAEVDETRPFWNPMTMECVARCPTALKPTDPTDTVCLVCGDSED